MSVKSANSALSLWRQANALDRLGEFWLSWAWLSNTVCSLEEDQFQQDLAELTSEQRERLLPSLQQLCEAYKSLASESPNDEKPLMSMEAVRKRPAKKAAEAFHAAWKEVRSEIKEKLRAIPASPAKALDFLEAFVRVRDDLVMESLEPLVVLAKDGRDVSDVLERTISALKDWQKEHYETPKVEEIPAEDIGFPGKSPIFWVSQDLEEPAAATAFARFV